jgi:hypothetical protein
MQDTEIHTKGRSYRERFTRLSFGNGGIGRVNQQGQDLCAWDGLVQQLQPLWCHLYVHVGNVCDVTTGSVKAGDETDPDWIAGHFEDDWMVVVAAFAASAAGVLPAAIKAT